ncbi:MAG: type I-MYXAN CRISPR-associated protein Cmx8 [Pyrinomonadaceae bacterium]
MSRGKKLQSEDQIGEVCEPIVILDPINYDPLRSDYNTQHRAGIAGLLLQLKAMELLRDEAQSEEDRACYIIPKYGVSEDGRALWIHFTKASFDSLMRERYRGKWLTHRYRDKKLEGDSRRRLNPFTTPDGKWFRYEEFFPRFEYFRVFEVPEAWQEHTRSAIWNTCHSSPRTRPATYKSDFTGDEINGDVTALWKGLLRNSDVKVKKYLYLNTWKEDLKGIAFGDSAEKVLLLHFWPLASTFFTPKSFLVKKDDRGMLDCKDDYQQPVVVIPDVTHVRDFVSKFQRNLAGRKDIGPDKRRHPDLFISTPREAALAFFFTPQLATSLAIDDDVTGARGAEAYTFKLAGRQAVVASIFNEPLDDYTENIISKYKGILKEIRSIPYRALQIENLIAGRQWHDGFDRLTNKFPHELFVPKNSADDSTQQLKQQAHWMARSVRADFKIHQEEEMNGSNPNVEQMILNITRNYIHWRAHNKKNFAARKFEFSFKKLNALRKKKLPQYTIDERSWLEILPEYTNVVQEVAEELFIRFRGRRDRRSFANLFTETFFRSFYGLSAERMRSLGSYLDGDNWESGKRLVLMSISAAGDIDSDGFDDDDSSLDDSTDGDLENTDNEEDKEL